MIAQRATSPHNSTTERVPGGAVRDKRRVYVAPAQLSLNQWGLSGDRTVGRPSVVLYKSGWLIDVVQFGAPCGFTTLHLYPAKS